VLSEEVNLFPSLFHFSVRSLRVQENSRENVVDGIILHKLRFLPKSSEFCWNLLDKKAFAQRFNLIWFYRAIKSSLFGHLAFTQQQFTIDNKSLLRSVPNVVPEILMH